MPMDKKSFCQGVITGTAIGIALSVMVALSGFEYGASKSREHYVINEKSQPVKAQDKQALSAGDVKPCWWTPDNKLECQADLEGESPVEPSQTNSKE